MRKPNCVVNDCRETDADEEQDDDRSRARLQRPLVSMMRVYAALGPTSNVVVVTDVVVVIKALALIDQASSSKVKDGTPASS